MNVSKTRKQQALDDIHRLIGYQARKTKGETMAAQIGYLMGWLSKIAAEDYIVRQELDARLRQAEYLESESKK